jgi:ribosomal-protein-alanine N-acetyltransferase
MRRMNTKMLMEIRKATVEDLQDVYNIERVAFAREAFSERQIRALLNASNAINLLAHVKGEVVGFSIGLLHDRENEKIGHLITLDVAMNARRRGVGFRLLGEFEKSLIACGAEECFLEVGTDNYAARELYRKAGYVEISLLDDYYHPGIDGVRMAKSLR